MNEACRKITTGSEVDSRDQFAGTAGRLGTAVQHVEKHFWICRVLYVHLR
jgi:hypothetical protein